MKKKEIFYKIADVVRAVKGDPPSRFTSAIIVAAGNSVRMGDGISKQMAMLDGMPVVVRTLRAYQQSPQIDEIIVVAREDEIAHYYEFRDKYRLTKLTHVVRGGASRQESVMNGLKKVRENAGFVAIADNTAGGINITAWTAGSRSAPVLLFRSALRRSSMGYRSAMAAPRSASARISMCYGARTASIITMITATRLTTRQLSWLVPMRL